MTEELNMNLHTINLSPQGYREVLDWVKENCGNYTVAARPYEIGDVIHSFNPDGEPFSAEIDEMDKNPDGSTWIYVHHCETNEPFKFLMADSCSYDFEFSNESDALAFKLRWGDYDE